MTPTLTSCSLRSPSFALRSGDSLTASTRQRRRKSVTPLSLWSNNCSCLPRSGLPCSAFPHSFFFFFVLFCFCLTCLPFLNTQVFDFSDEVGRRAMFTTLRESFFLVTIQFLVLSPSNFFLFLSQRICLPLEIFQRSLCPRWSTLCTRFPRMRQNLPGRKTCPLTLFVLFCLKPLLFLPFTRVMTEIIADIRMPIDSTERQSQRNK